MQKNQARGNQQRRVAGLIVLHARRAERFLFAPAGNVARIRRGFGLGGTKFADVVQFISRAGSVCRLRCSFLFTESPAIDIYTSSLLASLLSTRAASVSCCVSRASR